MKKWSLPTLTLLLIAQFACSTAPKREPPQTLAEQPEWCKELPRPYLSGLKEVPVEDDWFKVYDLGGGVFAINEPRQGEEVFSYLVVGESRAALIDTGTGMNPIKHVVMKLAENHPVVVMLTHSHFDHVGSASQFSVVMANETKFTRHRESGLKNDDSEWEAHQICGALPKGLNPETFTFAPFKISNALQDGERIDLGNRILKVVFTPGHTDDSVSIIDMKEHILFSGDTFYPGNIYLHLNDSNIDDYEKSLKKLMYFYRTKQFTKVYGSHNRPVSQATELVEALNAIQGIRSGDIQPAEKNPDEGYARFWFGDFGFKLPLRDKF